MNNGDLLPHPDQPIYLNSDGVPRFKRNAIVRFLQRQGGYNFDTLQDMSFSTEDWAQFMQLLGYSVCGYGDLSFIPSDKREHADAEAERLQNGNVPYGASPDELRETLRTIKTLCPGFGTHSPTDYIKAAEEINRLASEALNQ